MAELAQPATPGAAPAATEPASALPPSPRNFGQLLISTGAGRTSVVMFAIMLAICAWVLATFPGNFGSARWSNPIYWADNPKTAPPAWSNIFRSHPWPEQKVATLTNAVQIKTIPAGEIRVYQTEFSVTGSAVPSFLSMTLTGITYSGRPPVVIASLVRPDGAEMILTSIPVTPPRPGEAEPVKRYYGTPSRTVLTSGDAITRGITSVWQQKYNGAPLPTNLQDQLTAAAFGKPSTAKPGTIEPLPGNYTLKVQVVTADPKTQVAPVKLVVGGKVFGWMGTDNLGRDLMQGLLYGFPIALLIAALAAILSTFIGAALGIISGYSGGIVDSAIQRLSDIVSNVPTLPLLIYLVFVLGSHLYLIILVLVAFSWPGLTILVRSMVLQIRSGQLVEAAQALGASRTRVMVKHVFPQVAPFIIAQMIFFAPGAILAEAALSFLGLGDTSVPTWGQMLESGFQTGAVYVGYWWWVLPPGIFIIITAVAFMLLALAFEPIVDPRLRKQA